MKCVFCKLGHTKPGMTSFTHDDGVHVHVIRGVPAEICDSCGESYFSEETSAHLSALVKHADGEGIQVGVQRYIPPAQEMRI